MIKHISLHPFFFYFFASQRNSFFVHRVRVVVPETAGGDTVPLVVQDFVGRRKARWRWLLCIWVLGSISYSVVWVDDVLLWLFPFVHSYPGGVGVASGAVRLWR
jgi:hypothetical protein